MADMRNQTIACQVCGQSKRPSELMPAELVRPAVAELIRKEHPDWSHGSYICLEDLNHFRTAYVEDMLETERGELSSLEEQVLRSLKEQEVLTTDINVEFDRKLTFGERLADRVADFGGSWGFILIFASVLLTWIVINSVALLKQPFDPYPYILLNLVLSCLAAIQAPVIMMSQNRQEAKDRLRGEHDYRVNLKAELEIRHLNAKMDQLLTHQWRRLMEIQQIQMDLMEEFMGRSADKKAGQ
ncbi:MAG: hypothetical protein BWX88_04585 [Planctomycetes bacterium ADurb.Bin126]|nr:MAG: hypothetical protein BWX88_04585 [Planctomycetes bacterium ADurb.Bin126]